MSAHRRPGRERPPLDGEKLQELALRYVGRYATTRAKLAAYLARKVRERGWGEARDPDYEAIARRFAEIGYVDDQAYALAKARSLSSRGYGARRLDAKLRIDGVADADGAAAREHANLETVEAALRFARRRRIGPFAAVEADRQSREKAIAAMVRAGHPFDLARAIASLAPGKPVDPDELSEFAR